MCGICGAASAQPHHLARATLEHMCSTLRHRGPDEAGYFQDAYASLAMRRLRVIDLATGRQPIANESGEIHIVFNGEIYNYRGLRRTLQRAGHRFTTESDTEVILHGYEEYGADVVHHLNGMFAFAIWDAPQRRVLLARDRLGIKPLYYHAANGTLIFGSELKALLAHPDLPRALDPAAVDLFLGLEYIPAPYTILRNVHKLPAGHLLFHEEGHTRVQRYWDAPHVPVASRAPSEGEAIEELTALIRDAVSLRMVSDVPLGAFLSGGLDSSAIVSAMRDATSGDLRTFSIGFDDSSYDERPRARSVAQRFETVHSEALLPTNVAALTEQLVRQLDEPLGDFSLLSTYWVAKTAREQVTVALSGDGGDELFGGYDTYVAQRLDRHYRRLPTALRQRLLPALLDRVPPQSAKKGAINKAKRFVEGAALSPSLQHTRWMLFLTGDARRSLYTNALHRDLGGESAVDLLHEMFHRARGASSLVQQQYVDVKSYLAENILTKVDRMSMAVSLEARVPLLDHRIVEFALRLPDDLKLHNGQTKYILRQAMRDRLPPSVLTSPKQGFSTPVKQWLNGSLRPLMSDLLSPERIRARGFFSADCVAHWIDEHARGRVNHSHRLWSLMVLELWQQQALDGAPAAAPSAPVPILSMPAGARGAATAPCANSVF